MLTSNVFENFDDWGPFWIAYFSISHVLFLISANGLVTVVSYIFCGYAASRTWIVESCNVEIGTRLPVDR